MNSNYLLMVVSVLSFLLGCTKEEFLSEGDFFYLKSKKAVMPVWVKGHQASDVFIILLHGGPEGGSSQYYTVFPSHKKIEERFAMVYWDQRMCGMSQGNPSMADATLDQFTEDLHQLIQVINEKYDHPQLFLMGHSCGGALGTNYLLEYESNVKGWIEIDGGHNWTTANAISRDSIMQYAQRKANAGEEAAYWNFALDWYNEHPLVGINDNAHYSFIGAAHGYDYNPESDSLQVPFTDLLFYSPISTAYFFVPYQFSFLDQGLNLQDRLHEITIPTLLCWGKHDGVFPLPVAYDTYQKLGTPDRDKYLHVFDQSAHSPNYEQPIEFAREVIRFVEQYAY
jgi:pimeloyl-ACP methyl ester carboxylesterase